MRKPRIWVPNSFYHISCRGNRKDTLFRNDEDYDAFLQILNYVHEKTSFEIASYCFMSNHYHLQLRSKEHSISKVMALINKRYANYFNIRHILTGHVFEKRYFSEIINDRSGMLAVSRYIHMNPVQAEIVARAEDYPWSSYSYYKSSETDIPRYINREILLDLFQGHKGSRDIHYCNFIQYYVPSKLELME
ncbi:transposase [Virgibacillus sp. DJP39]|uniref:transposase n=1 Tax=Virgibacillus sp. DJP39 TaxID=3409790 RepID=UPI003BB6DC1E